MGETASIRLSRFAAETSIAGLSSELAGDVVNRLVDLIGVALAAVGDPTAKAVEETVIAWGGEGTSTTFGSGLQLSATSAALINGTLAHALDFDDTHLPSIVHPSSSVIPAALAVGEEVDASGDELLTSVAVGLEATVRLGMASYDVESRNHVFFERGLHATSILGTLGAAVAAGCLYDLGVHQLANAIGIASSMGAGLLEANRTGGTVKRLHNGWAAHSGVTAAQLARSGITGPPTVLEGRFGLFQAFSDDRWSIDPVTNGLGQHWEFPLVHYKPYPTNHFTHAGIDGALEALRQGVDIGSIRRIQLGVPEPTLRTIAEPIEEKRAPATGYAAKFSGPFTVAAALAAGSGLGVGHEDFTDAMVSDPLRLRLAGLVECVEDAVASERFPNAFGGVLRIWTDDPQPAEYRIVDSKGGPRTPLTDAELDAKFLDNVTRSNVVMVPGDLLETLRSTGCGTGVRTLMAELA
ncbi:MAG TPA: 2-methylcitrate dehydratase [Gemmatimonadetes bacterium]|nr:2-methylcitrate dehydratase [Gemmatimonadota bacterium]